MNWLQEFLLEDPPAPGARISLGRHLLIRTLPVAVASIIFLWITGGIPPTAVRLLIYTLTNFRTLWLQHGGGLVLPLLVLFVQTLLLCLAWALLLWLLFKERVVVTTFRASLRRGRFPSLSTSIVMDLPPSPPSEQVTGGQPNLYAAALPTPPPFPVVRTSGTPAPDPALYERDTLINPFEPEENLAPSVPEPPPAVAPPPVPRPPAPPPSPSEIDYFMANPFEIEEEAERVKLPEELLADPGQLPEPPTLTGDAPFLFGNPFEGEDLPDVLLSDEEIKKAPIPQPIKKKGKPNEQVAGPLDIPPEFAEPLDTSSEPGEETAKQPAINRQKKKEEHL